MKKEEGKISLLMLILIPVFIGIGVLIGYIVFSNKSVVEIAKPEEKIETIENEEDVSSDIDTENIEGIFWEDIDEANDSPLYVFYSDGTVVEEGNAVRKGTYEIDNNTIKIRYNIFIAPDDTKEEKVNEEQELKLVDENTIEGFIKCDVKKSIIGKWSIGNAYNKDNQQVELRDIFGSIITQNGVGDITFNENNTFTNYIGAFSSEMDDDTEGTYSITGDKIILKAKSGKTETIKYISDETLNYPYNNYNFVLKKSDLISNEDSNENNTILRQYIKGYEVKGYIEIPKTNVNEPILANVTKDSLENGFAIAYGPGLNVEGNTVIFVHNYKLYKNNQEIKSGDIINITDQSGTKNIYEVYDIQEIDHSDASYMLRDTHGNTEISIQTGNQDSSKRTIIFARKVR